MKQHPEQSHDQSLTPVFIYDDLDAFTAAYLEYERGMDLETAMKQYVENTSAAFPFYAERYGVTAESIAAEIRKRPRYYRRILGLKDVLKKQEPAIERGIARLNEFAPGNPPPPVYYLVGNMTAGGTPSELRPPEDRNTFGIVVAVEAVSMAPDADMSEFPDAYSGGYLDDIPYVVVHESMHVYQARIQGIENYRSIYRPGPNNTYLALAVREGCADYITYLSTGLRRTGKQHTYGIAHEKELWNQFRSIQFNTGSFNDGWFGRLDSKTPEWPPQIGYWLGMRICETYHRTASDPQQAITDIFSSYTAEQMKKFSKNYETKMDQS